MSNLPPSIFNDVLGPIMRGPSSSHSAASVRIGRLARDLAGGKLRHVLIEFDPNGSLATTHESQGSNLGLFGGLLGWEADDPRLPDGVNELKRQNIAVEIVVRDIKAAHPNTYQLTTTDVQGQRNQIVADSVGGGMIVVNRIDGQPVKLFGDQFVTLFRELSASQLTSLQQQVSANGFQLQQGPNWTLAIGHKAWPTESIPSSIIDFRVLHPVLPVGTPTGLNLPFCSSQEIVADGSAGDLPLSKWALDYETARSGWDQSQALQYMSRIRDIMQGSIQAGLDGTQWDDRILGNQNSGYRSAMSAGKLLDSPLLNQMVLYVTALMEAKSAMHTIVAAPTAGSCGTFAGTCIAAAQFLELDEDTYLRSMLAGGLIGVLVATRSSFAAEVGGCQAETGAGSAMAAASLVEMMGGSAAQSLSAASLALQNVLGLVCDPVANRVEAPCLGRNVAGASNALVSANMALAGYDALIPFDEVLDAHREISQSMPRELRCTALGGLSITPTSKLIELTLNKKQTSGCGGGCSCG